MAEVFKPIKGFEDYRISNHGRVYSDKTNKILKPQLDRNGYARVKLYTNGQFIMKQIHRLVAQEFVPNPNNEKIINHINCCKSDNHYKNLEWCNYSYNNKYAYDKGQNTKRYGSANGRAVKIAQFDNDGKFIKYWESISVCARELGIEPSCISLVCCGKRKTTNNFIFRKVDNNDYKN